MSGTPNTDPQGDRDDDRAKPTSKGNGQTDPNALPEDVFTRAARRRRDPDDGLVRVTNRQPSLIGVTTPKSTWYVRASNDPAMSQVHDLLQARELDDNHYFVADDDLIEDIRAINPRVIRPWLLHLAVTRQGTPFLWKCGLPNEEGALNSWHASGREMIEIAKDQWIALTPNKQAGGYDYRVAERELGEPMWPKLSWDVILRLAFRRYLISSSDHPLIRSLRGEN